MAPRPLAARSTSFGARPVFRSILTFAWYFDDLDYSRFEKLLETTYAAATYVRSALPAAGAKHKPAPTMPAPGPGPHRGGQPGMGDGYFVVRG